MTGHETIHWIAADWGTTHLRIWAMGSGQRVVVHRSSEKGMGGLERGEFEPALLELAEDLLPDGHKTPVVVCGMAGSRQGWAEAPYLATPCKPPDIEGATRVTVQSPKISVFILPGVKQVKPADVMRGEETQIAGFLKASPDFDGILCLPGTHTKWVHISAGEIVSFRTFMTGEVFALLSGHSVLRHNMTATDWDDAAFEEAVSEAQSRPEALASALFGIRASGLLNGDPPAVSSARLSGLLIGTELAASKVYWLGQRVAIIGADKLAGIYAAALGLQGTTAELTDAEAMTLNGLGAAFDQLGTLTE